jgi:membrane protein implicated in regulation of membrane protease activity
MSWWLWVAGGLLLVTFEAVTPSGFFILFFGLGALTVGVLTLAGATASLVWQGLLFTLLSVAYLLIFRRRLQVRLHVPPAPSVDSLVGTLAVVRETITPGAVGRVEARGAAWSARNTSNVTIESGRRCKIVSVDGLLLTVVPE